MKKILIATDGSPPAREAVHLGLELAHESEAEVTFVHVIDASPDRAMFGPAGPLSDWPAPGDYRSLLEAAKFAAAQGVAAKTLLLAGNTVDEIVSCADSIGADLIVVGSRGFGPIRATLLGSTSRALLHETRRPVLVVSATGIREETPAISLSAG
jgi:nucleotide-binding universal stress UspA family protein